MGFLFQVIKVFWNWISVMVVQLCQSTKTYLIVHIKIADFVVCQLYPNKVIKKNKSRYLRYFSGYWLESNFLMKFLHKTKELGRWFVRLPPEVQFDFYYYIILSWNLREIWSNREQYVPLAEVLAPSLSLPLSFFHFEIYTYTHTHTHTYYSE